MKAKEKTLATIGIIFTNVMWGLSFIVSKYALSNGLGSFAMIMLRYIVTPLALLIIMLIKGDKIRFPKEDWWRIALSGLLSVTVYFFLESQALLRISASDAALISAAIPAFTMLSGVIFHKKKAGAVNWIGMFISLVGVYLVVSMGFDGGGSFAGYLYMIGACISWVGYIEFTDVLLKKYTSLELTFWQSVFSMISLLPLGLTDGTNWAQVPASAYWGVCGFLGLICSALCFILYANSIDKLSPVLSSIYINLNPLAATLGSVIFLKESVYPVQILGGLLIIGSIYLINRKTPAATGGLEG